jgi:glyoxylase-like metal-dependent hydrolase (beta-lactamase superfamily II)
MTGPGTNSYLVGDPATGYAAIDPGPNEPEHLERLWRAAGGDIRMIVCTHSHPDHSPGARPLQALCSGKPPILGLPSAPTARAASEFTPDRALADGEELALEGGGLRHTLRVIHTPGHAANHLCWYWSEDGLLFSGDHILNGSTTVVDPPDGDMTAYLDSLDRLSAACETHWHRIHHAGAWLRAGLRPRAIAHLKAHRLQREAKVIAAMQARPQGTLETGWRWPTTTCPRACGPWPSARCWPTCSASRRWLMAPLHVVRRLTLMTEPVRLAKLRCGDGALLAP